MKIISNRAIKNIKPYPETTYNSATRQLLGELITTADVKSPNGLIFSLSDLDHIVKNFPTYGLYGTCKYDSPCGVLAFHLDRCAIHVSRLFLYGTELRADIEVLRTDDGDVVHELLLHSAVKFYKSGLTKRTPTGYVKDYKLLEIYAKVVIPSP